MKQSYTSFLPSRPEMWGLGFFSLFLILLGNAKDLLQRYGLIASTTVVHDQLSQGVGQGLQKLDSYSFTQNASTFVVWALIGLVSFSILQAVYRSFKGLEYEHAVSSNEYIHPANFRRSNFWSSIALDTFLTFIFLVLFATSALLYLLKVLPYAVHSTGHFLLHISITDVASLVLGLLTGFIGTYVVYICAKLVIRHHQVAGL